MDFVVLIECHLEDFASSLYMMVPLLEPYHLRARIVAGCQLLSCIIPRATKQISRAFRTQFWRPIWRHARTNSLPEVGAATIYISDWKDECFPNARDQYTVVHWSPDLSDSVSRAKKGSEYIQCGPPDINAAHQRVVDERPSLACSKIPRRKLNTILAEFPKAK